MDDSIVEYGRRVAEAVRHEAMTRYADEARSIGALGAWASMDIDAVIDSVPKPEAQHHEHTSSSEAPHHPACTQSFDARDWARDFNATAKSLGYCETDEGWLTGWFANAIMRGFDEAQRRIEHEQPAQDAADRVALVGPWSLRRLVLAGPASEWALQRHGMDWLRISEFLPPRDDSQRAIIDNELREFADCVAAARAEGARAERERLLVVVRDCINMHGLRYVADLVCDAMRRAAQDEPGGKGE